MAGEDKAGPSMTGRARRAAALLPLTVAVACAASGCAAPAGAGVGPGPRSGSPAAVASPAPGDPPAVRASPAAADQAPGQAGDRAITPGGVVIRHLTLADGTAVTTARFTGAIRFVLHCGTQDPGPLCAGKVTDGQRVTPSERPMLLAAFNGGFKLSAGAGGYEQQGRIISKLRPGLASLVIYDSGAAAIGIWGHGVPQPGQPVYSVRQNLVPLVLHGRPTAASAANWGNWGGTVTGVDDTARSALGQNARGQFIYVASMSATPPDMAAALVKAGAVIGMELDINQEWVQFDFAARPGGPLRKAITDQWRPANQYLTGWTRDFIAVLAPTAAGQGSGHHPVA